MSSFYDVLGLTSRQNEPFIPAQDLKTAYKKALLQYHPDKSNTKVSAAANHTARAVTVDQIALAYKTISDPKLRADYDRALETSQSTTLTLPSGRIHRTGLDTVDLDSLDFDSATETWSRSCRCGDAKGFVISEADLEEHVEDGEITVGCKGCSLWLRVLFSVEE